MFKKAIFNGEVQKAIIRLFFIKFFQVESLSDGTILNFSELAREFQLKNKNGEIPKNGGQIVKEKLSERVDLKRFNERSGSGDRFLRQKRRYFLFLLREIV